MSRAYSRPGHARIAERAEQHRARLLRDAIGDLLRERRAVAEVALGAEVELPQLERQLALVAVVLERTTRVKDDLGSDPVAGDDRDERHEGAYATMTRDGRNRSELPSRAARGRRAPRDRARLRRLRRPRGRRPRRPRRPRPLADRRHRRAVGSRGPDRQGGADRRPHRRRPLMPRAGRSPPRRAPTSCARRSSASRRIRGRSRRTGRRPARATATGMPRGSSPRRTTS